MDLKDFDKEIYEQNQQDSTLEPMQEKTTIKRPKSTFIKKRSKSPVKNIKIEDEFLQEGYLPNQNLQ